MADYNRSLCGAYMSRDVSITTLSEGQDAATARPGVVRVSDDLMIEVLLELRKIAMQLSIITDVWLEESDVEID